MFDIVICVNGETSPSIF